MLNDVNNPIKCLIVDDEPMARDVIRRYIEKVPILSIVGEFGNAIDTMLFLQEQPADLIFLDIQMPHLTGTEFVKTLKDGPKIIFTTAYKEYAAEGYDLDVTDYLLKPIRFERFIRSIIKAFPKTYVEKLAPVVHIKNESADFVFLKAERKMVKVMLDEILFIESARDYLKIFVKDRYIVTRQTISSIEAMLPEKEFVRIHRSFIVSIKKIQSFTHDTVEIGKTELPIGKFYQNYFLKMQGHLKTH